MSEYPPSYSASTSPPVEFICEGDAAESLIGVSKVTADRILKTENSGDALALYVFYAITSRWQKEQTVKATQSYCSKGLNWGTDRVRSAKETLLKLGVIEEIQRRGEHGEILGWYVKVKFIQSGHYNAENTIVDNNAEKPLVDNNAEKPLVDNKGVSQQEVFTTSGKTAANAHILISKCSGTSKRKASHPPQYEVEAFCQSLGLPKSDGEGMFLHWEEKEWPKNWKLTIQKWKSWNYLPSQKQSNGYQRRPETAAERKAERSKGEHAMTQEQLERIPTFNPMVEDNAGIS